MSKKDSITKEISDLQKKIKELEKKRSTSLTSIVMAKENKYVLDMIQETFDAESVELTVRIPIEVQVVFEDDGPFVQETRDDQLFEIYKDMNELWEDTVACVEENAKVKKAIARKRKGIEKVRAEIKKIAEKNDVCFEDLLDEFLNM